MQKYKRVLRKILRLPGNLNKKRDLILQSGGAFLPVLLKLIVAAGQYAVKNEARTANGSG